MTELVNLTPHDVVLLDSAGEPMLRVPPSRSGPVRVREQTTESEFIEVSDSRVTITTIAYGEVEPPLPAARAGVLLIVSSLIMEAVPDRADLVFPAGLVRDTAGNAVGCRFLGRRA